MIYISWIIVYYIVCTVCLYTKVLLYMYRSTIIIVMFGGINKNVEYPQFGYK